MIKINLAPSSELENPYWWLMDVVILLMVAAIGWGAMSFYFDSVTDKMTALSVEKSKMDKDYSDLAPKIESFSNLTELIKTVESKQESLSKVTTDHFNRYKPMLVLEVVQALKPEGVWINTIRSTGGGDGFEVEGLAFDNNIISNFISNLKSLNDQTPNPKDMRTMLNIKDINLRDAVSDKEDIELFEGAKSFKSFAINFSVGKEGDQVEKDEEAVK